MKKATLAILPLCLVLGACQNKTANDTVAPAPVVPQSEGNSSGGGGFGDESSMQLLKWSQQIVTRGLRQTNSEVFKNLPQGWNPERLAKLIETIRPEPNKVVYRYDRELMFDYVVPKEGEPYIIATNLFFRAFSSVPVTGMPADSREPYLREIRNRLLHETSHILGIGTSEASDYKARVFANYLVKVIWHNNVICQAQEVPENYPSKVQDWDLEAAAKKIGADYNEEEKTKLREKFKQQPYSWMMNRGFGFGMQTRKFYEGVVRSNFFIDLLLQGTPTYGVSFYTFPWRVQNSMSTEYQEPLRYFESAYFSNGETLVHAQYYKLSETKDGWAKFKGSIDLPSTANRKACSSSETFRIPQNLGGTYTGFIEFEDNCYENYEKPKKGEIKVQCTESYVPMKDLKEFFGDGAFQDPELIEILPNGDLD